MKADLVLLIFWGVVVYLMIAVDWMSPALVELPHKQVTPPMHVSFIERESQVLKVPKGSVFIFKKYPQRNDHYGFYLGAYHRYFKQY